MTPEEAPAAVVTSAWTLYVVVDRRLMIDGDEERNILVIQRNLESCHEALADCSKPVPPPPKKSRIAIWVSAIIAAFAAGVAADELRNEAR